MFVYAEVKNGLVSEREMTVVLLFLLVGTSLQDSPSSSFCHGQDGRMEVADKGFSGVAHHTQGPL